MNFVQASLPLVDRLGWVLVHSLWQFTLLALGALVLARGMRRCSAASRYWALLAMFAAIVVAPAVTFRVLSAGGPLAAASTSQEGAIPMPQRSVDGVALTDSPTGPERNGILRSTPSIDVPDARLADERDAATTSPTDGLPLAAWQSVIAQAVRPWLGVIVAAWCLGVLGFGCRPVLSWRTISRLRREGVSAVPLPVQIALDRVARRLGLPRTVRLWQSSLVHVPVVAGYFRPVILLPMSIVSGLPLAQLEAILAHELAHVRRHDYLVNLFQTLLETVFFYHPAVWWLSHHIRKERENCCDDVAVALGRNPVEYGRALLALEELRGSAMALALGAGGGSLLDRIHRLFGRPPVRQPVPLASLCALATLAAVTLGGGVWAGLFAHAAPLNAAGDELVVPGQPAGDQWPQWGGSLARNNVSSAKNLPPAWDLATGRNIRWTAALGTNSYGSPVVAGGKVLIGANNGSGRSVRYPPTVDLACLLCFDERTGEFLWQFSSEKLPTGRVHDWPQIGLCSTPCVVGDRVWFSSNRGEVVCLDLAGFADGQNDGPAQNEELTGVNDADVVWRFDMLKALGISPHHQSCSSPTIIGDLVLLNTGNGADESAQNIPAPQAPSFVALNRHTGHVVWQDASPAGNLLGGESGSASPALAKIEGEVQAIFAGSDGWVYAFRVEDMREGKTTLLWKFDTNLKESRYWLSGESDRNVVLTSPVVYEGRVYVATGQNPEHGEGKGLLWCIDPSKRGDISAELVFNKANPAEPIAHKRLQACEPEQGDFTRPNPNSGVLWSYTSLHGDGDGKPEFAEVLHRSCGAVTIQHGLLFAADASGIVHCLDARTGAPHWTHDLMAPVRSTPLIADGKVYIGDEDGEMAVFRLAFTKELLGEFAAESPVYATPAAIDGTLFVGTRNRLIAIQKQPGQ